MGFFDFLKGNRQTAREPPSFYVARNEAGEPIYSDDLVSELLGELEKRRSDRAPYELQWQLNADFASGNQNVDIDFVNRCLKLDEFAGDRVKERRVFNRISPLMDTRLANLMSVSYDMVVLPRTGEAEDAAKAKIGTKLLEYCQSNTGFRDQINQLLQWSEICGTAFTVSYWDTTAGDVIAEMAISEDGEGISKAVPIHLGDLAFGLLSPYEVFPQSLTVQNVDDQHDIITEQIFDVDAVRDIWGITVDGEETECYVITPEPKGVSGHGRQNATFGVSRSTRPNSVRVVTYYEKPTEFHEKGRLIVIVKDRIVFNGELPAGVMPIVAYKSKEVPGWFFGKSPIEALIPLQRSYNEIQNKIMDYVHVVVNAPMLTPVGSLDMSDMESLGGIQAGDIVEYDAARGKPEYMQTAPFSPLLTAQRDQLAQDMEYTAGVSQLMVYGSAANSASGTALNTRREIDMTRMSLTADNIRDGVIQMAKIWLKLNKAYSIGYRTVLIAGDDDMAGIVTWCADDINSYDVEFSAENELRHSRDQQREDFVNALQMGLFTDDNGMISKDIKRKAWELFKAGNMEDVLDLEDQQRKNARYEITQFQNGIIPREDKYADDEIHLEEHLRFALSNDYRQMEAKMPNWAAQFDQHIAEHRAKIQQKQQAQQAEAMQMQMMMNRGNGNGQK